MFVTMKEQLEAAEAGKYAVGMFNVMNIEMLQSLLEAAEVKKSPVIVGTSEGMAKYIGLENMAALVKLAANKSRAPISLHLDHGSDLDLLKAAIEAGYSSVMIDGSKHPFDENIKITKEVISFARPKGITVEGELGRIGGTEDNISVSEREALMTLPEEAERFAEATGVDCLAVSIGNAHGLYKGVPKLDFDRLREIKSLVTQPLVLHGASGIPAEAVKEAIKIGIRKVNIATDLQVAFIGKVRGVLAADEKVYDPRKIFTPAKEAMKLVAIEKMEMFGSVGKA
ncbi:MAG: class II fructose-1,6-bisphosphate aldolase [Actinomycetota bacterium]|nr:class II fructose-1,6-bisphosphate aldolase [Actinomycetota bacterium]